MEPVVFEKLHNIKLSHNKEQHILSYSALLNSSFDELADCKFQIMQLTSQVNNIFATLDQPSPKCTKRGIIHSLFNLLFGNSNSAKEIEAIKPTWQYQKKIKTS